MKIDKDILHRVCTDCTMTEMVAWIQILDLISRSESHTTNFEQVICRLVMGDQYVRDSLNHLYKVGAIAVSKQGDIAIPNTELTTPKKTKRKADRFEIPTLEEMLNYGLSKGGAIEVIEDAWNYYQSNGWKVGKVSMKDWKCALTRWIKNDYGNNNKQRTNYTTNRVNPPLTDKERAEDYADLAQIIYKRNSAGGNM